MKNAGKNPNRHAGTALSKYQRLESDGMWQSDQDHAPRQVLVRMREATLILSDPKTQAVISHWSLPAVRRLNPNTSPACFAPSDEPGEKLYLQDTDMIEALVTVERAVKKIRPRSPRLRGWLMATLAVAAVAAAGVFLPDTIKQHTAAVVPNAKRAEIGMNVLDEVIANNGNVCAGERGLGPLAELANRIFGPENTPLLYVMRQNLDQPSHLPGDVILLPRSLIEQDSPEALAGAALVESLRAKQRDPLLDVLDHAGLIASFGLLTSGELSTAGISGYGKKLLTLPGQDVALSKMVEGFGQAKVAMTPYLTWNAQAGQDISAALAADPYKGSAVPTLMADDDWIALQSVCSGV